ncbi:Imm43 family immunity protein [Pedobacter caeni]|uniref:Immunity protein 43 n=1 Tax=Pedobacter caeni TaxID=288992 RepID=A0A1M5JS44_9SPHI|nr:Imm43 family immunity protein [Pedobacter caeni]SHG43235.1 Immunity protein 43 [Pedobacter caeni]
MEDLFCLWPKPQKGVPVFLEGILAEKFDAKDPMAGGVYEWARTRGKKYVDYPEHLWLICKERLLLFDYYPFDGGFLVSDSFLSIIEKYILPGTVQYVPLKVCSAKGKKITDKEYFYLRFVERDDLINYEESEFTVQRSANNDLVMKAGFGIEKFEKIVLKNVTNEVFIPLDNTFARYVFCTEQVKAELLNRKMYGFDIIYYYELPLLYNERFR